MAAAAAVKCKACSKTVYVMDQQLSLPDGAAFHKSCFRCRHCNASLHLTNFSSMDGALYCKPHFQLLFNDHHHSPPTSTNTPNTNTSTNTPNTNTSTNTPNTNTSTTTNAPNTNANANTTPTPTPTLTPTPPPPATKPLHNIAPQFTRSPSKAAMMFSGTQDKCVTCGKTAYPLEKVTVEAQAYHKSCFRCSHGGCAISPSNYAALEGVLYCKHHFKQLFKEKGSYNHIMKSASIKRTATQPEPQPIPSSAPDA